MQEATAGHSGVLPLVKRRPRKVYKRVMRMKESRETETQVGDVSAGREAEDKEDRLLVMSGGGGADEGEMVVYMEETQKGGETQKKDAEKGEIFCMSDTFAPQLKKSRKFQDQYPKLVCTIRFRSSTRVECVQTLNTFRPAV